MEQSDKNSVEVVIAGEVVTLVGKESEEYFQKVARYIDKKISEINRSKAFVGNSFVKTLLISVNIADDFFKELDKNKGLEERVKYLEEELDKYINEMGKLQDETLHLKDKLDQVQIELSNSRRELDDYIAEFDKQEKEINQEKKNDNENRKKKREFPKKNP